MSNHSKTLRNKLKIVKEKLNLLCLHVETATESELSSSLKEIERYMERALDELKMLRGNDLSAANSNALPNRMATG